MSALVVAAARVVAGDWLDTQLEAVRRARLLAEAEGHIVGDAAALRAVEVSCLSPPALETRAAKAGGTGCVTLQRCTTRHHECARTIVAHHAPFGRPWCRQQHLLQRPRRTDRVRQDAHSGAVVIF